VSSKSLVKKIENVGKLSPSVKPERLMRKAFPLLLMLAIGSPLRTAFAQKVHDVGLFRCSGGL